VRKEREKKKAW